MVGSSIHSYCHKPKSSTNCKNSAFLLEPQSLKLQLSKVLWNSLMIQEPNHVWGKCEVKCFAEVEALAASWTSTACLLNCAEFLKKLVHIKRHPILTRLPYDLLHYLNMTHLSLCFEIWNEVVFCSWDLVYNFNQNHFFPVKL